MSSFFGEGVLRDYLLGKYYKPTVDERIFMFLDLNDATTIAEKIGPQQYSSFLRQFFIDLDPAFINTKGKVFQYVGDEVVVIWKVSEGLKNNNCINVYKLAAGSIKQNKNYYLNRFGIVPSFKAAVHLGKVSITEIGVSKKEIAYHGDAINTTARICSSAHQLQKQFLISKSLYDRLNKTKIKDFEHLGLHSFKGKNEKIELYGLRENYLQP